MSKPIHTLSALEMVQAFARGSLSPVEVAEAALSRIKALNPQLNAIYHLDADEALAAARESEIRWHENTPLGPLDGVPTTVKDALDTKGMPFFRGSAAGQGGTSTDDHPAVARMREAGSVILGKNTMCDYGILAGGVSSRHGVTRNPWNLDRTTGASSSGAAASVAAGIEPLSIGTDIVGSIRLPASFCGLAGFKPSQGRVPYYKCNSPALTAGPLARSFADVALHLNVLTRADSRDFTALAADGRNYLAQLRRLDMSALRVLVVPELGLGAPTAPDVRTRVMDAAEELRKAGAAVDICEVPRFQRGEWRPVEAFYQIRALSELSKQPDREAEKSSVVHAWTRAAMPLSAVDHHRNFEATQALRERTCQLIEGYDFVLLPSTPDTAFAADQAGADPDEFFESWCNTFLFNLSEQPASSVPAGLDRHGLPVGLQVVGRRFDDWGVLRLSWQLEQIFGQMPMAETAARAQAA